MTNTTQATLPKNKRKVDWDKVTLDAYEQALEDIPEENYVSVPNVQERIKELQNIAKASRKRKQISLKVIANELANFKKNAEADGRRYQTLINRFIHLYNRGEISV